MPGLVVGGEDAIMALMDETQPPPNPRDRLKQLQAIPERQRTDAEWDELNELEIKLAAGNREGAPQQHNRGNMPGQQGGQQRQGGGGQGGQPRQGGGGQQHHGKRQQRKFHQRPPKPR
jgi:hypothetical protein